MTHMGLAFNTHVNPLNTELNPICHLLALLGDATIVVVSRLRVNMVCHYCYYNTITMMLIMLNTWVTGYDALAHCPPTSLVDRICKHVQSTDTYNLHCHSEWRGVNMYLTSLLVFASFMPSSGNCIPTFFKLTKIEQITKVIHIILLHSCS
jgi:hypothetical protein